MVGKGTSSESSTSTAEPPLAKTQVLTIWFNRFTTGIYLTLPYTLSVFMVRSFLGSSASEERVGRNTGILAAAASVGQTLSAFMWGAVSDRVGRKPVLMVGNMSACLSVTALGLAPNYPAAVASRFIGGLFTAASGVALKSIIAESYGPVGQAKVIGRLVAGQAIPAALLGVCLHVRRGSHDGDHDHVDGRRQISSQEEEGEDQQPDLEDHAFSHDMIGADARQHHDKPWDIFAVTAQC
ncbi:hypothetical protein WJX79_005565 [Trebouxia sp. C0005]